MNSENSSLLVYLYIEPVAYSTTPYYILQTDGTYIEYFPLVPVGPLQKFYCNNLEQFQFLKIMLFCIL